MKKSQSKQSIEVFTDHEKFSKSNQTDDEKSFKSRYGKISLAPKGLNKMRSMTSITQQSNSIQVVCRFRPFNEKEKQIGNECCVEFVDETTVNLKSASENNSYKFTFDRVMNLNCTQLEMYEAAAKPIVDGVFEGFNGTIFTYGQTSSGKTFTMQGVLKSPELQGIIPRIIRDLFDKVSNYAINYEFVISVSLIEIYMEKIKDLVTPSKNNLNIREDKVKGIYIENLTEVQVTTEEELLSIIQKALDNRAVSATNMNEVSSRSHSIVQLQIKQTNLDNLSMKNSKLYLIDLAGSEKISKTGASGSTLEEAKMINKSLTCLGMVINCLTDGKSGHIPYRDSKLTRLLQDSLGGNAKTCLIIACSPSNYNEAETLSTLRFGLRAKKIKNKPKINKELTLTELKNEIAKLESELDKSKQRVILLENYIELNKLNIPKDENDLDNINPGITIINTVEQQSKISINFKTTNNFINNTNVINNIENNEKNESILISSSVMDKTHDLHDESYITNMDITNSQLKYEKDINKYLKVKMSQNTIKINEQTEKILSLEELVKTLTYKNEKFQENMNEINILLESKNKIIEDLNLSIAKYEEEKKDFIKKIQISRERFNSLSPYKDEHNSSSNKSDLESIKGKYNKNRLSIKSENMNSLESPRDISFSNKRKYLEDKLALTLIKEESTIMGNNMDRTINNVTYFDKFNTNIPLQEKENIINKLEEEAEKKLRKVNKFKKHKEIAGNFIFSNWNISNFKNKFKHAHNTDNIIG